MRIYRAILNLIVAGLLATGFVVPMITHDAPMAGFVALPGQTVADRPDGFPHWTAADDRNFPRCEAFHYKKGDPIPSHLILADGWNDRHRLTLDRAFEVAPKREWYVIGQCR